jgi:hypothetical protein
LLTTITPIAAVMSKPGNSQRPVIPISGRTRGLPVLAKKQLAISN